MNKIKAIQAIQRHLSIKNVFTYLNINGVDILEMHSNGMFELFLNDAQNNAPTLREFIQFLVESDTPEDYYLMTYIVDTNRDDTRFTVEGIFADGMESLKLDDIIRFRDADELDYSSSNNSFRAWWD